jgi:hypothetical protein
MRLMRSPCGLFVCVSPPNVAREQLANHVPAATNIHKTMKDLLNALFYLWYQIVNICSERKVDDYFFPELLVICSVTDCLDIVRHMLF